MKLEDINENKYVGHAYLVQFYKDQLKKFDKLGLNKETEHGVKVTESLINTTKKRLAQIVITRINRKIYKNNNE